MGGWGSLPLEALGTDGQDRDLGTWQQAWQAE